VAHIKTLSLQFCNLNPGPPLEEKLKLNFSSPTTKSMSSRRSKSLSSRCLWSLDRPTSTICAKLSSTIIHARSQKF